MTQPSTRAIAIAMVLVAGLCVGCRSGEPGGAKPSDSSPARAATYEEFGSAFCNAFGALFTAVGNPDTGIGSQLSLSFEAAVAAGQATKADQLATTITAQLEQGRGQAAIAAGWAPGAPSMAQLDRLFVAYEAMVAARRTSVDPAGGGVSPQAAFEGAGGPAAWTGMFEAARTMTRPAGAAPVRCTTVPVGI